MLTKLIMPRIAALLTSQWLATVKRFCFELYRKVFVRTHPVTFYYSCYDPYSHITAQKLSEFSMYYDIELTIVIVGVTNNIDEQTHIDYALQDCKRLSQQFQLADFSEAKVPSKTAIDAANMQLLSNEITIENIIEVGHQLWCHPDAFSVKHRHVIAAHVAQQLEKSTQRLLAAGHYQSSVFHYGNEWYWSIDRMPFLANRLKGLGACRHQSKFLTPKAALLSKLPTQPIPIFLSFRSPYSYIALCKIKKITELTGLKFTIKPILPMVMRGITLSPNKKMNILLDAARVAHHHNFPFGTIIDPLGDGINDCINLYYYAAQHDKSFQFIDTIMQGIWSQGLDINQPLQLQQVVTDLGLDWHEAQQAMTANVGLQQAHKNRAQLADTGLWGVPSFIVNNDPFWGQERLDMFLPTTNS